MKIALIRPDSQIVACPPPLLLGYLAGYLLKRKKDRVLIIDARRHRLKIPRIIDQLKDFSPVLAPKNFRTLKSIIDIIRLSFQDSVNY